MTSSRTAGDPDSSAPASGGSQVSPQTNRGDRGWTGATLEALDLMGAHPRARLAAIDELGMFVPMPPSVPMTPLQVVVEGHSSTLSLVSAEETLPVVHAWHLARAEGRAHVDLHPLVAPDTVMTVSFFDTREEYGTFLAVMVGPGAEHISSSSETDEFLLPRLASVRQDEIGVYTRADDNLPRILGYPDLVGMGSIDLVHPDDVSRVVGIWMDMLARPGCIRRMRCRLEHRDGGWVWFEVTMHNLLNDPQERSVVTELFDISDEMAAHAHIAAQETLLRRLTESLPIGIVQVDPRGRIVHRNAEIERLLGHPDVETLDELLVDVAEADAAALADATRDAWADVDADVEISVVRSADDVRRCQVILRSLPDTSSDTSGGGTGFIVCVTDVTEPARLRDRLHHRATYDSLTGCHNRASTMQELHRSLAADGDGPGGVAGGVGVIFLDLDGFKLVNDRRGHAAGDALLADIGRFLGGSVRPDDVVGRLGGDEFLVVCRGTGSAEQALMLAQRLATALAGTFPAEPPHAAVASIGVAWLARTQVESGAAETLVGWADSAMYRSKVAGDGVPVLFGPDLALRTGDPTAVSA